MERTYSDEAERILVRIRRVYDNYMEEIDMMAYKDIEPDGLAEEAAKVMANLEEIEDLYDDDPVGFCEKYGNIDNMEDSDVLCDWLIREFE